MKLLKWLWHLLNPASEGTAYEIDYKRIEARRKLLQVYKKNI